MTENMPERRPGDDPVHYSGADWEEAGLPAQEDDTQDMPLPSEDPVAMGEHGSRGTEREAGEPHGEALARERPDIGAGADARVVAEPEHTGEPGTPDPAARLVEADEGVRTDTEPELLAEDAPADRGGLTAEEEAVRVRPEDEGGI